MRNFSKKMWLGLAVAACWYGVAGALAQEKVTVVDRPDTTRKANEFYAGNREPLLPSPLIKLPIGAVKPQGWLRKQLELEADGFVGHLTEISGFCKHEKNAWLSPTGEGNNGWEEVPYWLRGFSALGYALDDKRIMEETKLWIEAAIASQREDGYFGPRANVAKGAPDLMPNMSMMFALRSYYEYTGDKRIIDLLTKYFKWQLQIPDKQFFSGGWQVPRSGDNLDSVYWLYNETGDKFLLELAEKVGRCGATWMKEPTQCHNVDFSQGFRKPGQLFQQNKNPAFLLQAEKNWDSIMGIYGQVPGGMFGGDEFARPGYVDPRQSIETCGTVDMMLSQQILLRITGDLKWADRCENAAYNSLPAHTTADIKALRYLTSPNNVTSDRRNRAPELADGGEMQVMTPHSHRCCQHNFGMGWPYMADNLWQATPGNGLAAVFYSACQLKAKAGTGQEVTVTENTRYPFDGTVEFTFNTSAPAAFPLYLRIPGWCANPQVSLNGKPLALQGKPLSYIQIDRTWSSADKLTLTLPMQVSVTTWTKNKNSASVNLGPLTFSVKIGEKYTRYGGTDQWPAWEITPETPWNYGLVMDSQNPAASFEVVRKPWPENNQVFTHEGAPVEIRAKARKIPNWKEDGLGLPGLLQPSPVKTDAPVETITLLPMGAARLRIAAFPVAGDGPNARPWKATVPAMASFWTNDRNFEFLHDGRIPAAAADERANAKVESFGWIGWAGAGTSQKHWVRGDFEQPETISSCEIYWFYPPRGFLTFPEWWKLYYLTDDNQWKEVELQGCDYTIQENKFTRMSFKPVRTTSLKIEAQTRKGKSSGFYEWRLWAQDGNQKKHTLNRSFGVDIMGEPIAKTLSSCQVTWHKDPSDPKSALPTAWKLFYRDGDTWKDVPCSTPYTLDPDKPNTVRFDPITTTELKMEVFATPETFAGPQDWQIK